MHFKKIKAEAQVQVPSTTSLMSSGRFMDRQVTTAPKRISCVCEGLLFAPIMARYRYSPFPTYVMEFEVFGKVTPATLSRESLKEVFATFCYTDWDVHWATLDWPH